MVDQQVTAASGALKLAEKLLLVPAEGDRAVPEPIADLIRDMEPAYADTLIAALQDKRALLTDDLGFRVVAQEAGAACTWTQALVQAGQVATRISHKDYRRVVAVLIGANHRFTQFGHAELVGELVETNWSVNDCLRKYAEMLTSDALDRNSVATLLAWLLIDSKLLAPDDAKFAAFHVAYADSASACGRGGIAREDYERALAGVHVIMERKANRLLLPRRLRGTTQLTPIPMLTKESRQFAERQVQLMRASLDGAGLWRKFTRTA